MNIFNRDEFEKHFNNILKEQFVEASEPIIKKALEDYEKVLRKKVADFALTVIQSDYNVERMQNRLLISVKLGDDKQ